MKKKKHLLVASEHIQLFKLFKTFSHFRKKKLLNQNKLNFKAFPNNWKIRKILEPKKL